ncbi:heteroproteinous nuclear ribonucleoprotein L isoform X3, partial [Sigmodon hispidus]
EGPMVGTTDITMMRAMHLLSLGREKNGPTCGGHCQGPRHYGTQYGHSPPPPLSPDYGSQAVSPVLMVSGLDQSKMNCDRVFNVFCLYGNVEKVKFMKSKLVATMVEMADAYAVD